MFNPFKQVIFQKSLQCHSRMCNTFGQQCASFHCWTPAKLLIKCSDAILEKKKSTCKAKTHFRRNFNIKTISELQTIAQKNIYFFKHIMTTQLLNFRVFWISQARQWKGGTKHWENFHAELPFLLFCPQTSGRHQISWWPEVLTVLNNQTEHRHAHEIC